MVINMKRFLHYFRLSVLGIAVLCVALGLAVLLWPGSAMKVLCYGFGGLLVLGGLLQVASYLLGEKSGFLKKVLLVSGIVGTVAGVWILLSPEMVLRLVGVVLGVVLLYHGIMDIKYGMDIRKCKGSGAVASVTFGLVTVGLGVLVLVDPFEADKILVMIMGISFVFDGATDLYTVFALAGAERHFEKLESAAPVIELDPSSVEVVPGNGEIGEDAQ